MGMLKRSVLLAVLLALAAPSLLARTHLAGYVEQGGQQHRNLGVFSILRAGSTQTNPYSMQSYPAATVTVYVTNTLTLATIYSDPAGTAKANPFTASSNAYWSFYVDDGTYDIRFSGGGIVTPYTWSGIAAAGDSFVVSITGLGAVCDGSTDDTVAIQLAIDLVGGHTVQWPAAACKTTDQLLVTQNDITVQGVGNRASQLVYAPLVGDEAAIKVDGAGSAAVLHFTLRNLFISTSDTSLAKIGLWLVDTSQTIVENIQIGTDGGWRGGANISPFTGTGSIGIKFQGRDYANFRAVASCGAIPLWIGLNPNFASIDLDHSMFKDLYLLAFGDNPNIYIESGANITTTTFEGLSFVKGGYGVYWNELAGSGSNGVTFAHSRAEQFASAGHMFFISSNTASIRGLRIIDAYGGTGTVMKGIYLRGIDSETGVVIDMFRYYGTIECLNADSTVGFIDWRASFCQGSSTASLGTLVEIWAEYLTSTTSPVPAMARWTSPDSSVTAGRLRRYMGVNQLAKTGTLADAATFTIPSGSGAMVTGVITISFKGATLNGAISCAVNSARTITLATTDATIAGCTGNVAGDFTLDWVNINNILIRNNLGETVTYNYWYTWN